MDWPLLRSVPERDRARADLLGAARSRDLAPGEVVCLAGDHADSLHLVVHGRLSVRVSLPSGDTAMINVLGPGSSFGELALLRTDGRRTATVTALEPTRTLVLTHTAFRRLCEARPSVEGALAVLLADRVERLGQQLLENTYLGLEQRVCRRLLDLTEGHRPPVRISLTQAQLGELTGGTRPTVNQVLRRLDDLGLVALGRGRIEVRDPDGLRAHSARLDS